MTSKYSHKHTSTFGGLLTQVFRKGKWSYSRKSYGTNRAKSHSRARPPKRGRPAICRRRKNCWRKSGSRKPAPSVRPRTIVPGVDTDDMDKIQVYVRHALSFLHSVTHRGGRVLFLESLTTFGSTEILNKMLHELAEVLGAPNREGRCGKVWWEYKQAWTEEVDERPPGCVVILNPEKRAHILRKARHAKVPIIALVDPVFLSDPKLHRDKRINHPIPVEGTEQLSGLISDLIYPKTLFLLYFLKQ